MNKRKLAVILIMAAICFCLPGKGLGASNYEEHIIAVDEQGRAMLPNVTKSGEATYKAKPTVMEGENTTDPTQAQEWRKPYYEYLSRMLDNILRVKPERVVIYIHGGLNNISGAIEKSALLTDSFDERKTYYIGICWNSDLMPTYDEHLFRVRNGLYQPGWAVLTSPLALLADVGSAASRVPLNISRWAENDAEAVSPNSSTRVRVAEDRYWELRTREQFGAGIHVSEGDNERSATGDASDAARWALTQPVKIVTTPVIDALGVQPWRNMLRRTRTMFDRETTFISCIANSAQAKEATEIAQREGAKPEGKQDPKAWARWQALDSQIEGMIYSGRAGATKLFCEQVLEKIPQDQTEVTVIGHSMGSIVACEMLCRFSVLPVRNLVFMAAACTINDFRTKAAPFLLNNKQTSFYNDCLNPQSERMEKNPGELDLTPRGSLLVWIDSLYEDPESETDRTFGRWENAMLCTDEMDSAILPRVTMKAFGRDRNPVEAGVGHADFNKLSYTSPASVRVSQRMDGSQRLGEPLKHGDFTRYQWGPDAANPSFAFWEKVYWEEEK